MSPSAGELGLETDRALLLSEVDDVDTRRRMAAEDYTARRATLGTYRALLLERDGTAPPLALIESRDELLIELAVLTIA